MFVVCIKIFSFTIFFKILHSKNAFFQHKKNPFYSVLSAEQLTSSISGAIINIRGQFKQIHGNTVWIIEAVTTMSNKKVLAKPKYNDYGEYFIFLLQFRIIYVLKYYFLFNWIGSRKFYDQASPEEKKTIKNYVYLQNQVDMHIKVCKTMQKAIDAKEINLKDRLAKGPMTGQQIDACILNFHQKLK